MSDKGRGWYGDSEGHRKAAKKGREGPVYSAVTTLTKYLLLLLALPFRLLGKLSPYTVEVPKRLNSVTVSVIRPFFKFFAKFNGPVRRAGTVFFSALNRMVTLPMAGLGFVASQARGTKENADRAWNYLTFDELLPPSIRSTIQWFIETIPKLLGIRSTRPAQQIGAAVSVIGVALLATFLTGGVLIGTVAIVLGFGAIGIARLVPAVDEEYGEWMAALPIKNDYDLPRWKRD